jgi:NADPH2:quinone reductase
LLPLLTGESRARHSDILAEATRLAEAGRLMPKLSTERFTLDMVGEAYQAVTAGRKVVVDIS